MTLTSDPGTSRHHAIRSTFTEPHSVERLTVMKYGVAGSIFSATGTCGWTVLRVRPGFAPLPPRKRNRIQQRNHLHRKNIRRRPRLRITQSRITRLNKLISIRPESSRNLKRVVPRKCTGAQIPRPNRNIPSRVKYAANFEIPRVGAASNSNCVPENSRNSSPAL